MGTEEALKEMRVNGGAIFSVKKIAWRASDSIVVLGRCNITSYTLNPHLLLDIGKVEFFVPTSEMPPRWTTMSTRDQGIWLCDKRREIRVAALGSLFDWVCRNS